MAARPTISIAESWKLALAEVVVAATDVVSEVTAEVTL